MRKILTVSCYLLLFVAFSRAEAYLDPGTGSLIIQAVAAMFLGMGIFWRNILSWFKKDGKEAKNK